MNSALRANGFSIAKIVGEQPRVTPALLVYCEKLVAYLTSIPLPSLLPLVNSYSPAGKTLLANLNIPGADIALALQGAIAQAIREEVSLDQENIDAFGLGRLYGLLGMMFTSEMFNFFSPTLNYGIYSCVHIDEAPGRYDDYSETDFIVRVEKEQARLTQPTQALLDGILLSESVQYFNGPVDHCLCLEGVALWPTVDSDMILSPNDDTFEGNYRLKASISLDGNYIRQVKYKEQGYLVFSSPEFLRGIQYMDRILKADTPSYKELEVFLNGAWRPARAD